jgi:hypothetical protein
MPQFLPEEMAVVVLPVFTALVAAAFMGQYIQLFVTYPGLVLYALFGATTAHFRLLTLATYNHVGLG